MKIICYGDSNTWGYDPRDPFGGQLAVPWCAALEALTGWTVVNFGENGRTVPTQEWEYRILGRFLNQNPDAALLLIMLGTNDLLHGRSPAKIRIRLEELLVYLKQNFPALRPILLAPPKINIPDYRHGSEILADELRQLAENNTIPFFSCLERSFPLAFDGVHLSEEGHVQMADELLRFLPAVLTL